MDVGVRRLYMLNEGLNVYAKHLKKQSDTYYTEDDAKEYLIKRFKKASRLRGVENIALLANGDFRIRTDNLFISTTETGKLRKFDVGKWEIICDRRGYFTFKSKDKEKLGFDSGCWGPDTVHPHIKGSGRACLGTVEPALVKYINDGEIPGLVIMLIAYLEAVNIQDGAGKYLSMCKEVALDDSGNVLREVDENGNESYVYITNEFDRERTTDSYVSINTNYNPAVDTVHNEYLVTYHSHSCVNCKKTYNDTYMKKTSLSSGESWVCAECVDKLKTCDICGGIIANDMYETNDSGVVFCHRCTTLYGFDCAKCGETILPTGTLDTIDLMQYDRRATHRKEIVNSNNIYKISTVCDTCHGIIYNKNNPRTPASAVYLHKSPVNNTYMHVCKDIGITEEVSCTSTPSVSNYSFPKLIAGARAINLFNITQGGNSNYNYEPPYNRIGTIWHRSPSDSSDIHFVIIKDMIPVSKIKLNGETRYIRTSKKASYCYPTAYVNKAWLHNEWKDIVEDNDNVIMYTNTKDELLTEVRLSSLRYQSRYINKLTNKLWEGVDTSGN